jgi:hypothetical protein
MANHLFIADSGEMFDTRVASWASSPLRKNYRRLHTDINSVADLKATLRNGRYAWPGGYPLYFVTSDGAALSFEVVRSEFRQVAAAIADDDTCGGWRVIACDVNWEDTDLHCEHSGDLIESAYGDA